MEKALKFMCTEELLKEKVVCEFWKRTFGGGDNAIGVPHVFSKLSHSLRQC